MADIIINGQTYTGVETITTQTTDGGTATFSEGEDMEVQTFNLPFSLQSGSDSTYMTIWNITDTTGISNLLSLITEKSNSNKLVAVTLKILKTEATCIINALSGSPFTPNIGFIAYISGASSISPLYYVITLTGSPELQLFHQGIPTASIQAIFGQASGVEIVVKYME